jgi:hypothetical protein
MAESRKEIKIGDVQGNVVQVGIEAAVVAGTIVPFVNAFCAELGKRFGGSVADWAKKIKLYPRRGHKTDLTLQDDGGAVTVVELNESLSDEAKLALLDLDIRAENIRGRRLTWDTDAGVWVATEKPH